MNPSLLKAIVLLHLHNLLLWFNLVRMYHCYEANASHSPSLSHLPSPTLPHPPYHTHLTTPTLPHPPYHTHLPLTTPPFPPCTLPLFLSLTFSPQSLPSLLALPAFPLSPPLATFPHPPPSLNHPLSLILFIFPQFFCSKWCLYCKSSVVCYQICG